MCFGCGCRERKTWLMGHEIDSITCFSCVVNSYRVQAKRKVRKQKITFLLLFIFRRFFVAMKQTTKQWAPTAYEDNL